MDVFGCVVFGFFVFVLYYECFGVEFGGEVEVV